MPVKNNSTKVFKHINRYTKLAVFCINVIVILLLIIASKAWTIIPSKAPIIASLGLLFPIILVCNILFLFVWLATRQWKFAFVQLIIFIVLWNPISTYCPINFKSTDVPNTKFKVLSYNVKAFNWTVGDERLANPIIEYIANSGADIVCLQEVVVSTKKNNTIGIISEEDLNKIMKDYPYRKMVQLGQTKMNCKYGIACYSKFPIESAEKLIFPKSLQNGAIAYKIKIQDKSVTLINNHLESNRITQEDKELYNSFLEQKDTKTLDKVAHNMYGKLKIAFKIREIQADLIQEYIEEQDTDATIVCGDFNDTPISYVYNTVKGDMIDSYTNTATGIGITYNEGLFLFRIDYIFHSSNIESYNFTIDKIKYSDHYPIWTYLNFK